MHAAKKPGRKTDSSEKRRGQLFSQYWGIKGTGCLYNQNTENNRGVGTPAQRIKRVGVDAAALTSRLRWGTQELQLRVFFVQIFDFDTLGEAPPVKTNEIGEVLSGSKRSVVSLIGFPNITSGLKSTIKIGYYLRKPKLKAMQTEAVPVRYGPSVEWARPLDRLRTDDDEDSLPKDPRQWSRSHVAQWLTHVASQHGLPEVPQSRFMMNGKALCLMSPHMFLARVPLGGKLLYKDFQLRLCAAMYSVD